MRIATVEKHGLRRASRGVTLLELMVVVTVIGVLGMVAIPGYRQYTMRANRTEAKAALLAVATAQERFYLQNNTYTNDFGALNLTGFSENNVYTLNITAANAITYSVTATPTLGGGINNINQKDDVDCASFTLDAAGARTAAPNPNGKCW